MMKEEMELLERWVSCQIRELGNIQTGTTPSKSNPDFYSREYPFYKPTDLEAGINVNKSTDGLSELGIKEARYVPENTTLITCIGATIGKTGFIRKGGGFNQQINSITPHELINPKYIYFQAISHCFQRQILNNASATTLPILNKGRFETLEMLLPPLPEQHRIVSKIEELFSSLDKGIESLKTAQAQLKVYRQAVLKWAFEGKLTNVGVKEGELPEGWVADKFGDVCEFSQGIQVDVNLQSEVAKNGQVRLLRIIDFTQGDDPPRYIDNPGIKYLLKKDEIAMVRYGTVGFVCTGKAGAIANNLFKITPKLSLEKKYLIHFLKSDLFRRKLESKGATMQALSFGLIKPMLIPIPPTPSEQHHIVVEIESRLSVCDKIEESISVSLVQAEALRQSILKKAFEGKLVPQDPRDEPAGVLLGRIRGERAQVEKKGKGKKVVG